MKIFLATLALALAAPVAAQTAPAHADHEQHGQHQQGQHHEGHDGCCADRDGNGRMDCCDQAAQAGHACACCDEHQPAQRR